MTAVLWMAYLILMSSFGIAVITALVVQRWRVMSGWAVWVTLTTLLCSSVAYFVAAFGARQ